METRIRFAISCGNDWSQLALDTCGGGMVGTLLYLDIPLIVLGMLALFAGSRPCFRRRSTSRSRKPRAPWVSVYLVLSGVACLIGAAIDMGFAERERRQKVALDEMLRASDDGTIAPMWPFPPGTPAPDFRLPTLKDGALVSLKTVRGSKPKPVLLVLSSFT